MCASVLMLSLRTHLSLVTEPQTEIEYQPIGEVKPNESNESSVFEVSSQPLPSEPEHPQVVRPEQVTKIDPSQSIVPTPVSYQLPPVQPVSGRPTGNETEPLAPPLVEPGYPSNKSNSFASSLTEIHAFGLLLFKFRRFKLHNPI